MEYKSGQSFKARVPFSQKAMKVHIDHVLPSIYEDRKLIIYRVYGRNKQYWHEFMCFNFQMHVYVENAK